MTITDQVIQSLKKRPACPLCGEKLECYWMKRQGVWSIDHGRGNGTLYDQTCKARFIEFSRSDKRDEGGNDEQAWSRTEERINRYKQRLHIQPAILELTNPNPK